ncbi:cysteine desulfurase SufS [Myxococcus xanthus DK 1622]|uniref:Cysteine desulfurase n=1 Tax=Myxococcus xanthus (strain DK1622) TaxID=246197 RepID=Q1DD57_MYXXD|nr:MULTISPECIES: SufS family cysteine desulfurase [Myxococcus]ABF93134.1 cysteine desulfurase SufS [Myxococcus xanthus DK 1622]NOJ57360.1 cysteine desulfurase [Myxococcus xanthus]QPM80805.1 cysteine desulfurase [Myxococcus xanthus]QVW69865.1 cysteine desulfurase [Myxococcus xanthus DZ2]QZZ48682.1 Cysteine desulfurase [Myxococcus xanthus]
MSGFDVNQVRKDFPILDQEVRGRPLVYLDSAATAQKPQAVIDALVRFYQHDNANVHRGVHVLSERATEAYEGARETVRRFINARDVKEVVFVRGTTEAINLVAQTYGRKHIGAGDEVLITQMEHHANIVPWRMLCEQTGAVLKVIPVDDRGELVLDAVDALLTERTRILAVTHVSNALGTVAPVKELTRRAHAKGIPVLVDGAQAVTHFPVDVQDLGCDFYAFSGHKMFGPTGIGVLYGRKERLDAMPPYQGGGDMILSVTMEKVTYNRVPYRFEAGTPNLEGAVGLAAAIRYLEALGMENVAAHDRELLAYATQALESVPGLRMVGTAREKSGVLSFMLADIHPHDVGTILDREGICIRTGHHCAQPVMQHFKVPATSRASLALYNTREDVDALVRGLHKVLEVFQ